MDVLHIPKKAVSRIRYECLGSITRFSTSQKIAAITFDDGPDAAYTPLVLQLLKKFNIRATFFLIGTLANKNPHIVEDIWSQGHVIGNHSWDHPSFPDLPFTRQIIQIRKCSKQIGALGNKLFRPPFGAQNVSSRIAALLLGFKVITWNVHTADWQNNDPFDMAETLTAKLKPGCVILLHDSLYHVIDEKYKDRSFMIKALELFLEAHSDVYRFVTIPELMRTGKPIKKYWDYTIDVAQLKRTINA
jgi:peptidoglycan-N-acetylglucosamine deacetylase